MMSVLVSEGLSSVHGTARWGRRVGRNWRTGVAARSRRQLRVPVSRAPPPTCRGPLGTSAPVSTVGPVYANGRRELRRAPAVSEKHG